jgi:D-glycero-D-manno-heptose 1,7-bisphosphate phosphatase
MLLEEKKEFNINMGESVMIGDKERDIEAGLNAGLKTTYLFDINSSIKFSKATKIVNKLDDIWK